MYFLSLFIQNIYTVFWIQIVGKMLALEQITKLHLFQYRHILHFILIYTILLQLYLFFIIWWLGYMICFSSIYPMTKNGYIKLYGDIKLDILYVNEQKTNNKALQFWVTFLKEVTQAPHFQFIFVESLYIYKAIVYLHKRLYL